MTNTKLTGKQYSFCVEYIRCSGNQSEAYRNSLYNTSNMKAETITNNASKLMQNSYVLTTIEQMKAETMEEVKEILKIELSEVINQIVEISKNAEKDSDKLKALDMLLKHLGGYDQKHEKEKNHHVNIPITHWVSDGGEATEEDFDKAFQITFKDFEKENIENRNSNT